jgi:tRNA 2-thiouridine synthesizing protein A
VTPGRAGSPGPPEEAGHPRGGADAGEVLDVRGERCPMPVVRLARAVRDDATPRIVTVLATDPAAAHDIPAWCRMRGHRYVGARPGDGHTAYDVEVLRPTGEAAGR